MQTFRTYLTLVLLLVTATICWAEKTDGLIVSAAGVEHQFAISDVSEITFSDEGLTLVKTDDATVEFSSKWSITFGEVETNGIAIVEMSDSNAVAHVYNVEGQLVKQLPLSELRFNELPKGVYIVSCNSKSFKILR